MARRAFWRNLLPGDFTARSQFLPNAYARSAAGLTRDGPTSINSKIAACQPISRWTHCGIPGGQPGYVFRWQSTEAPHCQSLMSSPDNEDWYDRYPIADLMADKDFSPEKDTETQQIYER